MCLALPWFKNAIAFEGEEVVVLSCVFASGLTAGLTHFMNRRLLKCNGEKVKNLSHAADLIDAADGQFIFFELDNHDIIALPVEAAWKVTDRVLKENLVPAA